MRGTCARVLAAALMTGAIANVVWVSALAGTQNETTKPLAAPAAPQPLPVRIRATPVNPRPKPVHRAERVRPVRRLKAPVRVVTRQVVTAHPRRPKPRPRQLASSAPPHAPPPAEPAAQMQTVAAVAPTAPEPVAEHGNGHAYGHDKARDNGHGKHED